MEVIFFTGFSKRKNSTKRPNDADGIVRTVTLKGQCDLMNPMFFLKDVRPYTYCKAWGNYYYIHRVGHDIDGAEYVYCNIDVLASWKNQILNTNSFVEFSSSNYSENLPDSRISQLVTRYRDRVVEPSMFVKDFTGGCYALSTANVAHGACTYIVNQENMESLINDLIHESPTEVENWQELFGDAMGSVIGLRYIPIPYDHFPEADQEDIVLGAWNSGYPAILHDGRIGENKSFRIPWRYSDFRRNSDFTRFSIALPFIGIVDILPESLMGYDYLTLQMVGNCVTGNISYSLIVGEPTADKIIATYNGSFGRQVPVAQGQVDLNGILNAGIAAGGAWVGAMLGFSQAAAVGVLAGSAIKAITSANMSDFTIIGGYSGSYGEILIQNYEMVTVVTDSRTEPSSLTLLYGRPCMQLCRIGDLTGYVQTRGFSIEVDALDSVRDMINSAMDGGVYLE